MGRAPPLLLAGFDASLRYADDNATPTSAAVGAVVTDGARTYAERSLAVDAFVSSTTLEFRALLEAVRAVDEAFDDVAALHVRGDADAVVRAVDPDHHADAPGPVARRRVEAVRALVADIPVVTYRSIPRARNRRAHDLAQAGHRGRD